MIIIVVAVVINSPLVLTKSVRSCGSLKAVKAADKCLLSYPPMAVMLRCPNTSGHVASHRV